MQKGTLPYMQKGTLANPLSNVRMCWLAMPLVAGFLCWVLASRTNITIVTIIPGASEFEERKMLSSMFPMLPILAIFHILLNLKLMHGQVLNVTDVTDIPHASHYEIKSFKVEFPL